MTMKTATILTSEESFINNYGAALQGYILSLQSYLSGFLNPERVIIPIARKRDINQDCPTLGYLENYPCALSLLESDTLIAQQVNDLEEFILTNYKKKFSYEGISKTFYECTAEYVCREFYETVKSIIPAVTGNRISNGNDR